MRTRKAWGSSLRGWTLDRAWAIGVLILAVLPGSLQAQNDGGWIGKRVITRFGTVLQDGLQGIDNEKLENRPRGGQRSEFRIYRVEHVNGPWLWLQAEKEGAHGWVQAGEVILYDQAIDYFTNEIRANPANDSAYCKRGHIWKDKKEYDIAIADYNEAIRLDGGSEIYWVSRGNAWHAKLEYDKAIADYNEAIRLDPNYTVAYLNRGGAWLAKKKYDKALADYNESIRLDPKYALAYGNRSVTQMILQRGEAVGGFKTVLDLQGWKGDFSLYAVILGNLSARQAGDQAAAKTFLDDAATRCDASVWPYPVVKFLRGELDEAGLLALSVDVDKKTETRCYLGLDHALKGRKNEALAHYRWVKEHGTTNFTEYEIAVAELDRLEGKPGPVADSPAPK